MENDIASCSLTHNTELVENEDLKELQFTQGINVWSTNQDVLEKQALKELEIFAKEQKRQGAVTDATDAIEEGEIVEEKTKTERNLGEAALDIASYIKKQEDLRKRQEYKKTLNVKSYSIDLANRRQNKLNKDKKIKRKKTTEKKKSSLTARTTALNNAQGSIDNLDNEICLPALSNLNYENTEDVSENNNSGSEYIPSDEELDSDYDPGYEVPQDNVDEDVPKSIKRKRRISKSDHFEKVKDDGLYECYKSRLDQYYKTVEQELSLKKLGSDDEEETEFHLLKGGLKIPIKMWNRLYIYQRDGVKWLWQIHQKATGALLGDEMGLGKTVQIIVFLHSLEYSRIRSCHGRFTGLGPTLIVCPATVIHQWVKHFHDWAPEFRVAVLHQSGNFQGNKADLIKEMHRHNGIIITTYIGVLKFKGNFLDYNWHYIILDEGHKIRNPTAKVSIAVKHLRTPHRLMLTGSPMQNNLTELWSLFDFTNPGMLGNLMTFQEHFATPILHGGFANSTPMQEATALSVASTLKNIISPFLLRRSKNEVQHHISLPSKSEQVLFCSLTDEQKNLYKGFLMSEHVNTILGRGATKHWFSNNHLRANVLVAITTLRKICNHPDIYLHEAEENDKNDESSLVEERFGYYKRSGKMIVVSALLKIWKKQGHRTLLFTQGRSMISVFQDFLEQQGYKYMKMDGSTSISSRQPLIEKFNQDSSYDVFLLTTRVGGLGINLTGANRVIIYDPDWNPATDTQARERAWRIGQEKQVTVYRLLSAGTIEEKMYQRQIWKQLLSNKVLLDPRTNRFFKSSDLHDLFSLQETNDSNPETANIFHDSRVRIQENLKQKETNKKVKKSKIEDSTAKVEFTDDKIQAMKNLAQQIAKSLSQKKEETTEKKTAYQLEFEAEREKKLREKEELKKLTPQELFHYNKEKAKQTDDNSINKIDDSETGASFTDALEYSEKTAKFHHVLTSGKVKDPQVIVKKVRDIREKITKPDIRNSFESSSNDGQSDQTREPSSSKDSWNEYKNKRHKKKKNRRDKSLIDTSGTLDGEEVEGLVRSERKKIRKDKKEKRDNDNEAQDNFVLGRLFSKKGVSGALQHESIIQSGYRGGSLRIHTEAKIRAERSLEALRKSRVDNWRW